MTKYCLRYKDQYHCDTDPKLKCSWDATTSKCTDKRCDDYPTACPCNQDRACFWRDSKCMPAAYGGCPDMDIVFAIDGTESMAKTFGRHPNGYYGLVEKLRDWVKETALTGQSAAEVASGTGNSTSGLRIGVVQFGGSTTMASKAPPGAGYAGGKISGLVPEISQDLEYHETHRLGGDRTLIAESLVLTAGMFQSPATRAKVLLIITDGMIEDAGSLEVR
jgi:hypothetical protein